MKKLFVILIIAALALGGWWFLQKPTQIEAPEFGARETVARAERRDLDSTIKLSGDVTPAVEVEIKSEVGGKVKAIHTAAGKEVQRGEVIVEIDDTDLLTEKASAETDIAGARLQVEKARRNFQRADDLFKERLISRELFDNTKSELEIAENNLLKSQSSLQIMEDRLIKTKVLSPTNGTVLVLNVIEGQVVVSAASVNSGTVLMTVADLSSLIINTHINQVDIAHVKSDTAVAFVSDAIGKEEMKATISFIAPIATIKNNIKGFAVQAVIENPDARLRPGMTVTLNVNIAKAADTITVPISAVFKDGEEGDVVYVRNGDSTEKRKVTVGLTSVMFAEILSGLEPGEEVLLTRPAFQRG